MPSSMIDALCFWRYKTPLDNAWHPLPGGDIDDRKGPPDLLHRIDPLAACVDAAPFVAGAGGLAHLRQLPHLGWTVPANVLNNVRTMRALDRAAFAFFGLVLVCQAAGLEYRCCIPRWAHERERRRDEDQVRRHVSFGVFAGAGVWVVRAMLFRGARRWPPSMIEPVLGGALADVLLREYGRAHSL